MNISKYLFLLCLFCSGCISEIDFDLEGEPRLSIGGVISNSSNERLIQVRLTAGFDTLSSPVSARGFLLRDGEFRVELEEVSTGILRLPATERILPGFSYQVQIQTEDGREFLSSPQTVKPAFSLDSMSFDVVPATIEDADGNVVPTNLARIFAHITLPEVGFDQLFFRWQIENSWIFRDSRGIDCYVQDPPTTLPATIVRGQDIGPGPSRVQIASRQLGETFLVETYFSSFLHSVDEPSFKFYESAERLVGNQGAIFDEIPGFIEGNLEEIGENPSSEPVLGFIEFSLADTTRLLIERGDFTFQLFDPCAGDFSCAPATPGGVPPPCSCQNCGGFFGIDSETKPAYWD